MIYMQLFTGKYLRIGKTLQYFDSTNKVLLKYK
jgi:hypothetical protein